MKHKNERDREKPRQNQPKQRRLKFGNQTPNFRNPNKLFKTWKSTCDDKKEIGFEIITW